jgi:hypothetical protein
MLHVSDLAMKTSADQLSISISPPLTTTITNGTTNYFGVAIKTRQKKKSFGIKKTKARRTTATTTIRRSEGRDTSWCVNLCSLTSFVCHNPSFVHHSLTHSLIIAPIGWRLQVAKTLGLYVWLAFLVSARDETVPLFMMTERDKGARSVFVDYSKLSLVALFFMK